VRPGHGAHLEAHQIPDSHRPNHAGTAQHRAHRAAARGQPVRGADFASEALPIHRFLPPIEPPNIFAIGRNYREHAAETGAQVPEKPLIFMKATTAIIGHDDTIVLPAAAPNEVDFEAELAVIIGRRARNVGEKEALDYVLGYTAANDVSARDCQRGDKQWSRAKGFDTFCPLGPWLVTADELNPDALSIRSRLNGRVMQDANTRDMLHSCRSSSATSRSSSRCCQARSS